MIGRIFSHLSKSVSRFLICFFFKGIFSFEFFLMSLLRIREIVLTALVFCFSLTSHQIFHSCLMSNGNTYTLLDAKLVK